MRFTELLDYTAGFIDDIGDGNGLHFSPPSEGENPMSVQEQLRSLGTDLNIIYLSMETLAAFGDGVDDIDSIMDYRWRTVQRVRQALQLLQKPRGTTHK